MAPVALATPPRRSRRLCSQRLDRSKSPSLRLNSARTDDIPAICGLLAAADGSVVTQTCDEVRRHLGQTVVVRRGDEVVGSASLRPLDGGRQELRGVVVSPKARGLGAGRKLVCELQRRCEAFGDALICVTRCPKWFAKLGFVEAPDEPVPEKTNVRPGGAPRCTMRFAGEPAHA